jgi:type I restriction-modification system DNA methylase subunit
MNVAQIENKLKLLVNTIDKETFIYSFLEAYFLPKASISRLQKGNLNLSKIPGEISWKKKLFFKEEFEKDLHLCISALKDELKHNQRFVVVTDYQTLLAIDTLTHDRLDIPITDLPKYYDFFLPWAGMEKATHAAENPADVKAAEKMTKLFDEIKKDNPDTSPAFIHNLNIFFTRLLFCYFAEDTNIFEDQQFTYAIQSHTRTDGSDLDAYLNRLFWALNTPTNKRGDIPHYLNAFPFVNGGLFKEEIPCPKFTTKSRQLLIDSGDNNDWSAINPDIFGSMFQAVISPEHRGGLGAHYTSVPNIMKVIEPLFLNDLKEAFDEAHGNEKKLKELLNRISKIKLFDPACGSGNFLIIAYKELRRLEMQILKALGGFAFSGIQLNNFYGIELDDFAHEIAKLSLWLAEHQMNVEFFNEFGRTNPTLPLQEAGKIVCGNACRIDWETVCERNKNDEVYILGNPPYIGSSNQTISQKEDMEFVFINELNFKNLDYISCWLKLGTEFIKGTKCKLAFVSTSSICQGEQVSYLWPNIIKKNVEIGFAHTSFKWDNNAKNKAAVSVIIIGLQSVSNNQKYIYSERNILETSNISPYLLPNSDIIVHKRLNQLSKVLPQMSYGNKPADGGHLILTDDEKKDILNSNPESDTLIKPFLGSNEIINKIQRWCLWITDENYSIAINIPKIMDRIKQVEDFRKESPKKATKELSKYPFKFAEIRYYKSSSIIVPRHSSENRDYIPFGFVDENTIISDSSQAIYDAEAWVFSVLISKFHLCWIRTIGGRLEDRLRYSSSLCYNTFPFPSISNQRKEELTQCTFRILEEREKHPEKTLADLYDPDKMPDGLREAHRLNDEAVERCYRSTPFTSDEERLEYLFKLYEKMIAEENNKGTLFETEKKPRKKK